MRWGVDKLPHRDANRVTNVCLVSLTTRSLGYPYMNLKVALAASIAAFALMACSKQEAAAPEAAAPAPEAAAPAAEAPAAEATPAPDAAAAPAEGTAAPAEAPAEAPKQ